jgi:hypothetical protein
LSGLILARVTTRVPPKPSRNFERINSGGLPPGPLIAGAMSRAVMDTAQRYREFIARLTAKRARLYEPQVMRIRRFAGAQKAWLEGDVAKMLLVAVATWRTYRENALVDPIGLKLVGSCTRVDAPRTFNQSWRRLGVWRLAGFS